MENIKKKKVYQVLYFQVLFAIVVGILLGYFYPQLGAKMKPLGDGFISLIKMLIAPIIFTTVVVDVSCRPFLSIKCCLNCHSSIT